jgi:SAM-dependent methyltransferase
MFGKVHEAQGMHVNSTSGSAFAKSRLIAWARRWSMLSVLDQVRLVRDIWRHRDRNTLFRVGHPSFALPPARLAFEAHDHVDWHGYQATGLADAKLVAELIESHHHGPLRRVCEWGCGPGRVIRHLRAALDVPELELVATDVDKRCIAWCGSHMPDIRFLANRLHPPLPLENAGVDCLYALSVFTHLSERAHADWMDELVRVVRPGGLIIFTTHGRWYRHILTPSERHGFDAGRLVVRGSVREGCKLYTAFHPESFVRGLLPSGTGVVEHLPRESRQDVWIFRVPQAGASSA